MLGAAWAWKAEHPGLKRHHFFPSISLAFCVTLQFVGICSKCEADTSILTPNMGSHQSCLAPWEAGDESREECRWHPGWRWLSLETLFFLFIFNWRITALQCCVSFCCWTPVNQSYVYICPLPPAPPSYTPPHPTRLSMACTPCAPTAATLWLSILHTVVCMFQCCSLNPSHPLLPPLHPQVCSLCISIPALQIGLSVPLF